MKKLIAALVAATFAVGTAFAQAPAQSASPAGQENTAVHSEKVTSKKAKHKKTKHKKAKHKKAQSAAAK